MKTINDLTKELSDVFNKTKSGEMDFKVAAELSNIAGKIIKGNLGQLQYYEIRDEKPSLAFWEKQP